MTKPKDWKLTCTSCGEEKKVTGLDEFKKHREACVKQKAQAAKAAAKAAEAAEATAKANARRRRKHN